MTDGQSDVDLGPGTDAPAGPGAEAQDSELQIGRTESSTPMPDESPAEGVVNPDDPDPPEPQEPG